MREVGGGDFEVRAYEGMPDDEVLEGVAQVSVEVFGPGWTVESLREALRGRPRIYTQLALDGDRVVGFKLGYEQRPYYFESWIGGVTASARRRGIADELQRQQHAWCVAQGFRIVTTITSNDNAPMIILNLRHDYRVVGSFFDREDHVKLILQKRLGDFS